MELKDILQERNSLKVRNLNISARKAAKQMSKTNPIAFYSSLVVLINFITEIVFQNIVWVKENWIVANKSMKLCKII